MKKTVFKYHDKIHDLYFNDKPTTIKVIGENEFKINQQVNDLEELVSSLAVNNRVELKFYNGDKEISLTKDENNEGLKCLFDGLESKVNILLINNRVFIEEVAIGSILHNNESEQPTGLLKTEGNLLFFENKETDYSDYLLMKELAQGIYTVLDYKVVNNKMMVLGENFNGCMVFKNHGYFLEEIRMISNGNKEAKPVIEQNTKVHATHVDAQEVAIQLPYDMTIMDNIYFSNENEIKKVEIAGNQEITLMNKTVSTEGNMTIYSEDSENRYKFIIDESSIEKLTNMTRDENVIEKPTTDNLFYIKDISIFENKFLISKEDMNEELEMTNIELVIFDRDSEKKYRIKGSNEVENCSFDFTALLSNATLTNNVFNVYIKYVVGNEQKIYRIAKKSKKIETADKRYQPFFEGTENYNQSKYCLYLTNKNSLSLIVNNENAIVREIFGLKTRLISYKMKKNIATVQYKIEGKNLRQIQLGKLVLVHRNKDNYTEVRYLIEKIEYKKGEIIFTSKVDMEKIPELQLFWDFYVEIKTKDRTFGDLKLSRVNKITKIKVDKISDRYEYSTKDNYLIYPYITLAGTLAITKRKREWFETKTNLLKEKFAYIIAKLVHPILKKKHIWIGFEKFAESAHDSGYHFFNYVYTKHPEHNYYYVIDKNANEYKNLIGKEDKVLNYMSLKYFIYLFNAELLISSDTKRNVYNLHRKKSLVGQHLESLPLIYLQHGMNGLKYVRDFYKDRNVFDLVVATSEYERELIVHEWGYPEDEVITTGLARWDVLEDRSKDLKYKKIIIMPTWRTWMREMSNESFMETEFFKEYNNLLTSVKLNELYEKNNIKVVFFLHPKFRQYQELFKNNLNDFPNVQVFDYLEISLENEIMESSMMISDYSSVIWEMFYLKKPCVFYHFDVDKYQKYEGMYLDPQTDMFGDIGMNVEEISNIIEGYASSNFSEREKYAIMRDRYFSHIDQNNSARIYEGLLNYLEKK